MALSNIGQNPLLRLLEEYARFQGMSPAERAQLLQRAQGNSNNGASGDSAISGPDTIGLQSGPMSFSGVSPGQLGMLALAGPAAVPGAMFSYVAGNLANDLASGLSAMFSSPATDFTGLTAADYGADPGSGSMDFGGLTAADYGAAEPGGGPGDGGASSAGDSGGGDGGGSGDGGGGGDGGYKRGGFVKDVGMKDTGPDQTHIRVTPGEYVVPKAQVAAIGAKKLKGRLAALQRR